MTDYRRAIIVPVISGPQRTRYALVNYFGEPDLPARIMWRLFNSVENATKAAAKCGYVVN